MRLVWFALLMLGSGSLPAAGARLPLELAWLADGSAAALLEHPIACAADVDDPAVRLGRLAFNSPRLLGGQAGRMGLSCASCHPAGRSSKHFFIAEISDQAGYADISHAFLSSAGADEQFNPRPIPDLAELGSLKFNPQKTDEYDAFLTQLIQIEFDGQPPPAEVFSALKRYLGTLNVAYCEMPERVRLRSLNDDWQLLNDGLVGLVAAMRAKDRETVAFIGASMRATLETLYRFFGPVSNESIDSQLESLSRAIQVYSQPIKTENIDFDNETLNEIIVALRQLETQLQKAHSSSFYNPTVAEEYLRER